MNPECLDIPSQHGRTAVITGTGGLGYQAASRLAAVGAVILLAGRNAARGHEAIDRLRAENPFADIRFILCDLASLTSVAETASALASEVDSIDILLCNAGIMSPPQRRTTVEGFELQFGVNHLGHFALVAQMLPLLQRAPKPRVISVTSLAQHHGDIDFDDLHCERCYIPGRAYIASKLAQACFAVELQRRSDLHAWGLASMAAHPGFSRTRLFEADHAQTGGLKLALSGLAGRMIGQSAAAGAAPLLHAATSPEARGGVLYGPKGRFEMKGPPGPCNFAKAALDPVIAARLWKVSEDLVGIRFPD